MNDKSNYITLIEHVEYNNVYEKDFVTQLINKEICSVKDNKIKFKVTGILVYKNTLIIIFPKNYKIPLVEKCIKEHAQILLQVLLKYKQVASLDSLEMDLLSGDDGTYKQNIFTAYQLFLDYIHNGLLKKEFKTESFSYSGRTDWVKTINKKQPVFSGGSIIYTDPVSNQTTIDNQHLLLKIQNYCMYKITKKYGWLFNAPTELLNLGMTELPCNLDYAINFLTKELNNTFIEREIKTITFLREFITGIKLDSYGDSIEVLATPYFHNVWEVICGEIFNNQYDTLKKVIPKLKWEIDSNARIQSQRPDILLLKDEKMYILDAKYYNIDKNLPGWPDIVKQLFYAVTILKNIKSEDFIYSYKNSNKKINNINIVENAFLFPSSDYEPIKYIGKVSIEGNEKLGYIKAYKINTTLAMKCYINKAKYDFIDEIHVI